MAISTKELLKDDNVIEDLGMERSKKGRGRVRMIVAKCSSCDTKRKVSLDAYKRRSGLCRSCSAKKRDLKSNNSISKVENRGRKKTNQVRHDHPIYKSWTGMKARCYNENCPDYSNYGAKDIEVCDEWKNDFNDFYDWSIANGWDKGLCLDKDILCDAKGIEPKAYRPDTCQWITRSLNSSYSANQRRRANLGLS